MESSTVSARVEFHTTHAHDYVGSMDETLIIQPVSYSMRGASAATGLSERSVARAIQAGDLPVRYYGTKPLILFEDLREWIRDLPDEKRR